MKLQSDEIEMMGEIQDGLSYAVGESNVSVRELMDNGFIAEHTNFLNWNNFLKSAGIESEEDFEKPETNDFIKRHTEFESWEEMLVQASNYYVWLKERENALNAVL
jgi:hypothetical protein